VSLAFRRICLLAALALLAVFVPLAQPALAANFAVTSLADSTPTATGTLRWAITQANASGGPDTITFNVTGAIALTSALPALSDQLGVTIDARVAGVPSIELRGGGGLTDGLQVLSSNNIIRGLIVNGFTGAGIAISGSVRSATNNLVEQCYIGTNAAGNAAGAAGTNNNGAGVHIRFGASSNTINNNVI